MQVSSHSVTMARILETLLFLFLAVLALASGFPGKLYESKELESEFNSLYNEVWRSERSGKSVSKETYQRLQWYFDQLRIPNAFRGAELIHIPEPYFEITCTVCYFAINTVLQKYESGATRDEIVDFIVNLCTRFNIETEEVCRGAVELNADIILYIANNSNVPITKERMCGVIFQSQCPFKDEAYEWSIDLSLYGEKPAVKPFIPKDDGVIKVLQITDIHHDRNYEVGGNAACDEPSCCRLGQGRPTADDEKAGYWGDYRTCDLPWQTVQSLFQNAATTHKDAEYVMMTGDLVDHGVWATTIETNKAIIKKVSDELRNTFGDKPVYPVLGNHESSPVNVFAPVNLEEESLSTNWVYETISDVWSPWLNDDEKASIKNGGFYTTLVKPGFRIVVLNNMVCYVFNWWLMYNPSDQDGQLQWLAQTLAEAEKNEEKVHILAHIPSGSPDCFKVWSREYRKIINRFENTIVAQFTGHTHREELHLYYDQQEPTRATAVSFCGGSGTTFTNVNPNYRVYYVDGAGEQPSWAVIDYESWIFNMTAANLLPEGESPDWFKMYSFREAFGVDKMTIERLEKLTHEMMDNQELLRQYFRYYVSQGDPFLAQGCDQKCLQGLLCEIVTSQPDDPTQCTLLGLNATRASGFGDLI